MKKNYFLTAVAAVLTMSAYGQVNPRDIYRDGQGLEFTFDIDNWYVSYEDSDEYSWILTAGQEAVGNVVIPNEIQGEKVRIIGAGAFRNWDEMAGVNPNLTSITIPDNVEIIQMAAFLGCANLKKIDLNKVRRIDYATFVNCTGLEEIHIRVPAATMKFGWTVFNMMTEEGGFGTDVIPATIYVPKGELQNYIGKYANPYSDPEDPMTWEDNVLYEFYKAGRLKEEGDGPVEPQTKGDVNGDDVIDVEDVNGVINMILNISNKADTADLNGDGVVDVEDVNALINVILKVK